MKELKLKLPSHRICNHTPAAPLQTYSGLPEAITAAHACRLDFIECQSGFEAMLHAAWASDMNGNGHCIFPALHQLTVIGIMRSAACPYGCTCGKFWRRSQLAQPGVVAADYALLQAGKRPCYCQLAH